MHPGIVALFSAAAAVELPAEESLFVTGDTVTSVFLVAEGELRLLRHSAHGQALVLQRATSGMILAEASVYGDRYHCDAVASLPSRVRRVSRRIFRDAVAGDPVLADAWAALLSRSVQAARLRAEIRGLPRVRDRLDAWLASGQALPPAGQRTALASELGVSREALYRELARRRRE